MADQANDIDLPGAYLLAFEEAGRALDAQERTVNELRSRAGVLIAAAAISTSFFGSRAIQDSQLTTWTWVALGSFLVVGAGVLFVLWPRHDWSFSANATDVIATYVEPEPLPLPTVHRDLAIHRSTAYDANADQLRVLFWVFRTALTGLVVETSAWIVVLANRV